MTSCDVKPDLHGIPTTLKSTLVLISVVKRQLGQEIPAEYRLRFLDHLDHMTERDDWLTAEVIAAVQPICSDGYAIVREAMSLGAPASLDVYSKVFPTFAMLNSSLCDAINLSPRRQAEKGASYADRPL